MQAADITVCTGGYYQSCSNKCCRCNLFMDWSRWIYFQSRQPTITNANTGDAGTYTVTVTFNGCSDQCCVNVTVNAPPTANAGSNSPVCEGGNYQSFSTKRCRCNLFMDWSRWIYCQSRQPTINNANAGDAGTYTVTVTLMVAVIMLLRCYCQCTTYCKCR